MIHGFDQNQMPPLDKIKSYTITACGGVREPKMASKTPTSGAHLYNPSLPGVSAGL